jgi:hypothetical protein
MWLVTDDRFFLVPQVLLLGCWLWAVYLDRIAGSLAGASRDDASTSSLRASANVIRGDRSMAILGTTAGFITTVIALINSTALKEEMWLKHYSVVFNIFDVCAILYLCFMSRTAREWILGNFERARID